MIGLLLCGIWSAIVLSYTIWRVTRPAIYFEWRPLNTYMSLGRPKKWYERWWWKLQWWCYYRWIERDFGPVEGDLYQDVYGNQFTVANVGADRAELKAVIDASIASLQDLCEEWPWHIKKRDRKK